MNKVTLEVIVTQGADNATLSEAAVAWLELESAFKRQSPRRMHSLLGSGAMGEAAYVRKWCCRPATPQADQPDQVSLCCATAGSPFNHAPQCVTVHRLG
jgi:hypothetical protein